MEEILQKYKLAKEKDLKNDLALCKDSSGKRFVLKKARQDECVMGEMVNKLARDHNDKFTLLQLPEYTTIDAENGIVIMPFYDGRDYHESWDSDGLYGGAHMKLELVKEMAQIVYDFSKINIDIPIKYLNECQVANFQFDFIKWKERFANKASILQQKGWISQEDTDKANGLLKDGFWRSKLIFNNGDYYPRNILSLEKRIVVVDWQTWSENYRANIIDYIENVAAFAFIHMWENHLWQIEFLKGVREYFRMDFEDLRRAILIKSFEQALFFEEGVVAKEEVLIFKNMLDNTYARYLEKNTRPPFVYRIFKKKG